MYRAGNSVEIYNLVSNDEVDQIMIKLEHPLGCSNFMKLAREILTLLEKYND